MPLVVTPLNHFPMVEPGDDLGSQIIRCIDENGIQLEEDDIFVLTQKIISKSEDCYVDLNLISPSQEALKLSAETGKDPRLIEVILGESNSVIRKRFGSLIVEHKLGFICASAGVDHSNIPSNRSESENLVLLLPKDPNKSALDIRNKIQNHSGRNVGVLIIDTQGRPWRIGVVGMSIGISGLPAVIDERGWKDLYGSALEITVVGVADELASAASLMMGQANEGTPVVHVRGFPYKLTNGNFNDLLRSKDTDLFR